MGNATGAQDVRRGTESEDIRRIKATLLEERKSLVDSLKSDLPAYLNYKFEVVASETQLDQIRGALSNFEGSVIQESLYEPALKDGLFGYNWFFDQINQLIRQVLYPAHIEHGVNSGTTKDGIDTTDLTARQKPQR